MRRLLTPWRVLAPALTTIHRLAYGAAGHSGRLAAVPPGAVPLTYDVTLAALQNPKEKWEMDGQVKVRSPGLGHIFVTHVIYHSPLKRTTG